MSLLCPLAQNQQTARRLRERQDTLLDLLRQRQSSIESWMLPLWAGGPSPYQLGKYLFPRYETEFNRLIEALKG